MTDPFWVVERLVVEQPAFHAVDGQEQVWNALPGTLRLIARHVRANDRTLETGCGASTAVFAAAGARHLAISPQAGEHERVRAWCRKHDIPTDRLEFVAAPSDRVLPNLELESIDAAFIDGKHAFPAPVVDFHYVEQRLRVGGLLLLDDAPIPAVAVVVRHLRLEPRWEMVQVADERAVAFRKLAEAPTGDPWADQPFNRGYPDLSLLPPAQRLGRRARRVTLAAARRALRR